MTTQQEVAFRLQAKPGTEHYGYLSLYAQLYSDVEIVGKIPGKAFYPEPKVTSSIIKITPHNLPEGIKNEPLLHQVIKSAFNMRRKTILNGLKHSKMFVNTSEIRDILQKCDIAPDRRGETLSLQEFIKLANFMEKDSP